MLSVEQAKDPVAAACLHDPGSLPLRDNFVRHEEDAVGVCARDLARVVPRRAIHHDDEFIGDALELRQ
ncbi:MAG: hypothetical protein ACJ8LI_00935 [Chthoniobacterales bacterium]